MFSTFEVNLNDGSAATSQPRVRRERRLQVRRACDRCRRHRTKCDAQLPCRPCSSRGHECEYSKGRPGNHTAAEAERKIEALEAKIRTLETKLETGSVSPGAQAASSPASSGPHSQHDKTADRPDTEPSSPEATDQRPSQAPGAATTVSLETAHISNRYFLTRMRNYMQRMLPDWTDLGTLVLQKQSLSLQGQGLSCNLSKVQETYMLYLFWHSWHALIPIVNVPEFQELHESLWADATPSASGQPKRRPSALVDIVMALCMQYCGGMGIDLDEFTSDELSDTKRQGLYLFHRCRYLLARPETQDNLEKLQCIIYSAFYCLGAGDLEAGLTYLTRAVDLARQLKVFKHKINNSSAIDYLQIRIWWQLMILESRIRLCLDRPTMFHSDEIPLFLVVDEAKEAELLIGDVLPSFPNLAPLTGHTQIARLSLLLRKTYTAFQAKCTSLLESTPFNSIYESSPILEACAASMFPHLKSLQSWAQNMPEGLKMKRRGTAEPFSTSKTPLQVEPHKPLWLQRQQIFLELHYHHTMAMVYRLFITFTLSAATGKKDHTHPIAFGHAVLAVSHAATTTNILDQLLSETEMVHGWSRALYLQWDAAITLAGYAFANPVCTFAPLVRKALRTAVANFDALARCGVLYGPAAARQTQIFIERVDEMVLKFGSGKFVGSDRRAGQKRQQSSSRSPSASASPSSATNAVQLPESTAAAYAMPVQAQQAQTQTQPQAQMQAQHHQQPPLQPPTPVTYAQDAPDLPSIYDNRFKQAFDSISGQGISFSPHMLQEMIAEPYNIVFDARDPSHPSSDVMSQHSLGLMSLEHSQNNMLSGHGAVAAGGFDQADIHSVLGQQVPPELLGAPPHWMQQHRQQHQQHQQQQGQQRHH